MSIVLIKLAGAVGICASDRSGLLKKEESCGDGVTNQRVCSAVMEKQRPENSSDRGGFSPWVKFLVLARRKPAVVVGRNALS